MRVEGYIGVSTVDGRARDGASLHGQVGCTQTLCRGRTGDLADGVGATIGEGRKRHGCMGTRQERADAGEVGWSP